MPFDSLATPPELPPDLSDAAQGRRIRDILLEVCPDRLQVSLSHEVVGELREYERVGRFVTEFHFEPAVAQNRVRHVLQPADS